MTLPSELEKTAIKQHLFNLIKRLDDGNGVTYDVLLDIVLDEPWNRLLDDGVVYEPILGVIKCL